MIEYPPISAKDQSKLHQFGKKASPGMFLVFALVAGWNLEGEILVADIEELGKSDASEIHAWRPNAKRVLTSKKGENFHIPMADGTANLLGRDHEIRESTLRQYDPVGSKDLSEELQRNSEEPQPAETKEDAEARNDFWSIEGDVIYRHHTEPRVHFHVPKEESFTIPWKSIDVTKTTHTSLDVLQEKRINDYWNVDGDRTLSDSWTGFTKFTLLNEKPPPGFFVV